MSTQISSVLEESYEIFQRIFYLLEQPQFQASSFYSQNKFGSQQIDRTFEESVVKAKHSRVSSIAARIQQCIVQRINNQAEQYNKYEEQLRFLQAKLRKQTKVYLDIKKNEIQSRLLIETLQEENENLRKQILTLKDELIDKQKALEGTQLKMKTEIKTLQSQIYSLKRLDNLFSDKKNVFQTQDGKCIGSNENSKKKSAMNQIKNRLSFCDEKDFHSNFFDPLAPKILKAINITNDNQNKVFDQKEKKKPLNSASRRSSYSSLSKRSCSQKQVQIQKSQNSAKNDLLRSKKNLNLKQLQPKIQTSHKKSGKKSISRLKIKK